MAKGLFLAVHFSTRRHHRCSLLVSCMGTRLTTRRVETFIAIGHDVGGFVLPVTALTFILVEVGFMLSEIFLRERFEKGREEGLEQGLGAGVGTGKATPERTGPPNSSTAASCLAEVLESSIRRRGRTGQSILKILSYTTLEVLCPVIACSPVSPIPTMRHSPSAAPWWPTPGGAWTCGWSPPPWARKAKSGRRVLPPGKRWDRFARSSSAAPSKPSA